MTRLATALLVLILGGISSHCDYCDPDNPVARIATAAEEVVQAS